MGVILAAEPGAGAGHEDDGVGIGGGEEAAHVYLRLFHLCNVGDTIRAVIIGENVAMLEIMETSKDSAGMADEKGLVCVLAVRASDGVGSDKAMVIGEREGFYGGV